jgi:hypothetical protein
VLGLENRNRGSYQESFEFCLKKMVLNTVLLSGNNLPAKHVLKSGNTSMHDRILSGTGERESRTWTVNENNVIML